MLRRISGWAADRGVPVRLAGVDLVPWSARAATLATPPDAEISYHLGDIFDWPDDRPADAVVSSLFAHHLSDPAHVRLLRRMARRPGLGGCVNALSTEEL